KDAWAVNQSNRLLEFFLRQGIDAYGNQYSLEGDRLSGDHSAGLVAMNAVACLASNLDARKEFVGALWNLQVPTGPYRYYDGMLYMLGMLQVSGNFRIFHLTPAPIKACNE
ncbi:MAG TPA: glycoside hydrolase, partial [Bacteroidota bacterium]|nr:glycoside hydrolase [Bacteroidota bacterium]